MKLKDLQRGIVYTVTKGVPDGSLAEGDIVALCIDGSIVLQSTGGWLDSRDPADMKYIDGYNFEINSEYYLSETQTSVKFAAIPRSPQRFPWDNQLDAIAMASQKDFKMGES